MISSLFGPIRTSTTLSGLAVSVNPPAAMTAWSGVRPRR
jgi:hypothetical protein